MIKLHTSFMLGFFLCLISLPPLHAQTAGNATTAARASTANPTPAGQAPDEATRKISELVHARRFAEAQQLTTGLLLAYPNDQRLIKSQALLEKLLSPASLPTATAASSQPAQPAPTVNAEPLTGMDKVDYNALIELAKQAQQTSDLPEQQQSLQQFMDQSSLFLQKHPDQILLWQLRAASAISLNKPLAGYDAAQKLLAAGAADTTDANLQRLLAQLKNKGWLDKQEVERLYEQQRYILVAFLGEAADKPANISLRTRLVQDMTALLLSKYPSRQIHYTAPAPGDSPPILTVTINVHDTTLSPCTYSMVRNVWKCPAQTAFTVAASSPQGWQFNKAYTFSGGTSGVGWGVPRTPLSADQVHAWISQGVTGAFKGILDASAVHAALGNSTPEPAVSDVHSSAPMGNPAAESATPALHNSVGISNPAALAAAPASQPALLSSARMNSPIAEPVLPAERTSATVENPASLAAAPSTTVLHVYRPHHLTAAAQKTYIYVDGNKITPIANSQEIRMLLIPGKHSISVWKKYLENELPINDLDMIAGNEYWIRVDISAGAWAAHSKLYIVPTDQAKLESKRMEEIRIGEVSMN